VLDVYLELGDPFESHPLNGVPVNNHAPHRWTRRCSLGIARNRPIRATEESHDPGTKFAAASGGVWGAAESGTVTVGHDDRLICSGAFGR
jgi:hypothetical protein